MLASSEATMTLPEGVALHARPGCAVRAHRHALQVEDRRRRRTAARPMPRASSASSGLEPPQARRCWCAPMVRMRPPRSMLSPSHSPASSSSERSGRSSDSTSAADSASERAKRDGRRLLVVQRANPRANARDRGGADAELVDAQPDEQRHHQRIRGRLAAHLDRDAGDSGGLDGVGDRAGGRRDDARAHRRVGSGRCRAGGSSGRWCRC